jgi:hypothetical protein
VYCTLCLDLFRLVLFIGSFLGITLSLFLFCVINFQISFSKPPDRIGSGDFDGEEGKKKKKKKKESYPFSTLFSLLPHPSPFRHHRAVFWGIGQKGNGPACVLAKKYWAPLT